MQQEGLEIFFRTMLTFTGKGLLFAAGLAAMAAWGFAAAALTHATLRVDRPPRRRLRRLRRRHDRRPGPVGSARALRTCPARIATWTRLKTCRAEAEIYAYGVPPLANLLRRGSRGWVPANPVDFLRPSHLPKSWQKLIDRLRGRSLSIPEDQTVAVSAMIVRRQSVPRPKSG